MADERLSPQTSELQKMGIDEALLDHNLALNYEQRLFEHQCALELADELRKAGTCFYEQQSQ